ncbi:MAG: hypothetical protein ACOX8H_04540 [Ruminococcus sp.]|jgi:hypothetical protein
MNSSDNSKLAAGILAAGTTLLFFAACLAVPAISSQISSLGNLNLITYGGSVILFCLSFLLYCRLLSAKTFLSLSRGKLPGIFSLLFLAGSFLFLGAAFLLEGNLAGGVSYKYVWHNLPFFLVALAAVTGVILFFRLWKFQEIPLSNILYGLYYACLTALIGYTFYTPNVFGRYDVADTAHGHAYFNSIYNVYHGSAYTETTTSIYGHYGLFYKLPMKILGGNFTDFILLTACIGALCFLCSFLALHLMIKNSIVRLIGCLAMTFPILSMRGGYYWQLWPHRILFASLMTLFAAFCIHFQKLNRITWFTGYLICLLGIVWNTESGIFCAAAWAGLWLLLYFSGERRSLTSLLKHILWQFAGILFSFFGAFGAVNLYNILQDSAANSLKEFLFPLMSSSYMTDLLRLDLPLYPAAYMMVLLLFLIGIGWGISHMKWCRINTGTSSCPPLPLFCFFLSVLSLGQITYFINRPAYHNLDICHIPAVILMCILADLGLPLLRSRLTGNSSRDSFSQAAKKAFSLLSLCVLPLLCAGTILQYSYNTDIKKNYHNLAEFQDFANTIAAEIPPHTYGFGVSVAEVYSLLGWSTNCYTLDFTDLSVRPQTADYIIEDIKEKEIDAVFTGQATIEKMKSFAPQAAQWFLEHFTLSKEYEFGGSTFRYYIRN